MPAIKRITSYDHHDDCEKKVYANWINRNLFSKRSLNPYIPINPNGDALFDLINDGVIFCEILSRIFPKCIDLSVLMIGSQTTKENKIKNLQLAIETARSFGCQIDGLRVNDIFSGVRQSILELFWQIFYIGLVVSINYERFPEIDALRESGEPKNAIKDVKPEEILVRYVNFEIRLCNPGYRGMRSFRENLNDGSIYALLIESLSQQQSITLKNSTNAILKEKNDRLRNDMLFENFYSVKMQGFVIEELMNSLCSDAACYKMHLLTIAMFFHEFGINPDTIPLTTLSQYDQKQKLEKESNIEKLCQTFLNFISVKPIVTNLRNDCRDGLIFAQVMTLFSPELFRKDLFITDITGDQIPSKQIHNGAIVINRLVKYQNVPVREMYPEYIQGAKEKVICGVLYNLMLHWAINANPSENDPYGPRKRKFNNKELIAWVNDINKGYKIHSFRDSQISDKNILAKVIEFKCPKSINWDYLNELKNRKDRAIYCISVARREGYPMFIHPPMLSSGDYRCTTLAFCIMREKIPSNSRTECPD